MTVLSKGIVLYALWCAWWTRKSRLYRLYDEGTSLTEAEDIARKSGGWITSIRLLYPRIDGQYTPGYSWSYLPRRVYLPGTRDMGIIKEGARP